MLGTLAAAEAGAEATAAGKRAGALAAEPALAALVRLGAGAIVPLTRAPGIRQALDWAYKRFAKNRLKWTGRCDEEGCALPRDASP